MPLDMNPRPVRDADDVNLRELNTKILDGETFQEIQYGVVLPDGTTVWDFEQDFRHNLGTIEGREWFLRERRRHLKELGVLETIQPYFVSRKVTTKYSRVKTL